MNSLNADELKELYEEFYDQAQCGYITWKITGEIVRLNATFATWLGYTGQELLNQKRFSDLLSVSGKMYYETHFAPLLFIQGSAFEIQMDLKTKSGELIPVLVNARLRKTDSESYSGNIHAAVFDIRQRKQYEKELLIEKRKAEEATQKLREMNQGLQQFASIVSHDLKSPLSGIISMSEYLASNYKNTSESSLETSLKLMHQSSKQIYRYIDGLLNYYRHQQDYCTDVHKINVEENIRALVPFHALQKIKLVFNLKTNFVWVNQTVFEQIFMNLISNAINYNDKEQIILTIENNETDTEYQFSLKDNGMGIPESKFETIFELFKTLGHKDRFNRNGTGIGLATVKKIIESSGGSISISSQPGVYTQFTFSLKKCETHHES